MNKTAKAILNELQVHQSSQIAELRDNSKMEQDTNDLITLYHGTSAHHLPSILENGIQPKTFHNNSNYDESNSSNSELVYLTNNLGYYYAFGTTMLDMAMYEKENNVNFSELALTDTEMRTAYEIYYALTGNVPILIEVSIPRTWLYFDEDIAYSRKIRSMLSSGELKLDTIDYEISLQQHTCTSIFPVPLANIEEIQTIAYLDLEELLTNTHYGNLCDKWVNGLPVDMESFEAAKEELMTKIEVNHMGALDTIAVDNKKPTITYEDSAVYISTTPGPLLGI